MKCQKCRQPIKLHGSLEDLSPAAFNLLIGKNLIITPHSIPQNPDRAQTHESALCIGSSSHPPQPHDHFTTTTKLSYPQDRRETYDKAAQHAAAPVFKRSIPSRSATTAGVGRYGTATSKSIYQNPAESYVMLTQSQVTAPQLLSVRHGSNEPLDPRGDGNQNALSHQMKTSASLFDILSARSDIDYPICTECTDLLVDGLTKRLSNATRERDAYVEFLKKVNAEIPTDSEREAAEKEMRELKAEEEEALRELQDTERQRAEIEAEIRGLEEESKALDDEEEEFWRERNSFSLRLEEFQNERDGVNLQYDHDSRQLEKLQRTNVYNDTFCIGHDGYFGTINGLRLGRLPNQPVWLL